VAGIGTWMKDNKIFLLLLVLAAAVFTIFICPFLEMHALTWVCVLFYVLVVVAFIYGRSMVFKPKARARR